MTGVNYENIERYLTGKMSSGERANFERDLAQNKELADELYFYQYVNQSISKAMKSAINEKEYKEELQNISRDINDDKRYHFKPKRRSFYQRITDSTLNIITYSSATVAVIVLLFLWSPWKKNLVDQYASDMTMMFAIERGSGNESTIQDAVRHFNAHEYQEALSFFDQLLDKQTNDTYLLFYHAISLLHTGEFATARNDLLNVYSSGSIFQYEAAFYIALSYASAGNNYDALRWLENIPSNAYISEKANALKKKL
ncbi:hypothetical protein SAMN05216436_11913 [bacterium A37T11]|nr:hypothetical protein SAMN05216436_11913 [bacterium A37T11]